MFKDADGGNIYLAVTLELTFHPLAAGLSVPQGLGNGPELRRSCRLLLFRLLQLRNTVYFTIKEQIRRRLI